MLSQSYLTLEAFNYHWSLCKLKWNGRFNWWVAVGESDHVHNHFVTHMCLCFYLPYWSMSVPNEAILMRFSGRMGWLTCLCWHCGRYKQKQNFVHSNGDHMSLFVCEQTRKLSGILQDWIRNQKTLLCAHYRTTTEGHQSSIEFRLWVS